MDGRILRVVAVVDLVLAVLALGGTVLVDRWLGVDVVLLVPNAPSEVAAARALWLADGAPTTPRELAAAHGRVVDVARVIAPDEARVLRPPEAPGVVLYPVAPGEAPPLTGRTLRFAGRAAAVAFAAAGLLVLAIDARRRRRSA